MGHIGVRRSCDNDSDKSSAGGLTQRRCDHTLIFWARWNGLFNLHIRLSQMKES